MKYIVAQSANLRFQWELDVLFTNIFSLDANADIVCLYASSSPEANQVYDHTVGKWGDRVEIHMYADMRPDKNYTPTFRPYLMYCYLKEDPAREQETYFQIDSDIIFRELPKFTESSLNTERTWYGSDCSGYISYDYIRRCNRGEEIAERFAEIIGVDSAYIRQTSGVGAHVLMVKPTAQYWLDVYDNCNKLHYYLEPLDTNIQKWTAEMWAQLYTAGKYGVTWEEHPELAFCMATDDIAMWDLRKIYHNNGVVGHNAAFLFNKNQFILETPFGHNFDHVYKSKCSSKYVEAIQAVLL